MISCPLSFHRCRYMQYAVVFMFRELVCLHEWRKQHKVTVEILLLLYSEVQQVKVLNDLKGEREAGSYSLNVITMSAVWVSGDDTLSSGPWCVCLHSQTHPSPLAVMSVCTRKARGTVIIRTVNWLKYLTWINYVIHLVSNRINHTCGTLNNHKKM